MYPRILRAGLSALALSCTLASVQAAEHSWSYTYTAQGQVESADGPRTDVQDITRYAYDAHGNLVQVTDALGHVTTLGDYDERGKPGRITDANGTVSILTYTGIDGWLASVTTAGSTTRFDYDAVGQITRLTRADGSWLAYTYDDARRLVAIANNLGERLEYDVDAMGNRTAQRIKDASGTLALQQRWVYDELGRLLRSVGAGGQTRDYSYDLNGNPVGESDPKRAQHVQAFDPLDRLASQRDPLGGTTALDYDAQDNLTQVRDPRGVTTRYEYDGLGNLTALVSPDSGTTRYLHDEAGNVLEKTDARGHLTQYRYDALNRLVEQHHPSNPALDIHYTYDLTANGNKGIGHLTAVEDGSGSLEYRYDEQGRLVEQTRRLGVSGQFLQDRLGYAYDAAGQLVRIDYPDGLTVDYRRNAAGQVSDVSLSVDGGAPTVIAHDIAYQAFGPLKRLTWGNGIVLDRQYDQDYQLVRQQVGPWQDDYQHDAKGNIERIASSLWGTLDYRYDALDRLTEERESQRRRSYTYDAVGNRLDKTETVLATQAKTRTDYQYATDSNRLTAIGSQAVTSDESGNLTQDRASRLLGYDEQGRLKQVNLNGQSVAEYRYNALGQRVAKLTAQGILVYLYGPDGQVLGETRYDASGRKLRSQAYLWLDSFPLATRWASYTSQGVAVNPRLLYLHGDHLDTPRLATDTSATPQIVWQWQSDAFGNGTPTSADGTQINLRFPGQYHDGESGLRYNYFRDYDPQTGRYVESDPIGLRGGLNTFGYVGGNPLKNVDPKGLVAPAIAACAVNPGCVAIVYEGCTWALLGIAAGISGTWAYEVLATGVDEGCEGPNCPIDLPSKIPDYSHSDPGKAPVGPEGDEWTWKGRPPQGGDKGGYKNPNGPESIHPDLNHGGDIGPHWDFNDRKGPGYRIFPNGVIYPK
ncbi:RHS repeat-associated core domain-containing protein [Pseudomonas sp. RIT-PI-AD]|uniref:RHS repeat-associated core domain-containing protein n=1 Tax=Pseudomonas sp. RIT-PI-AD TaxID=3035294 RepID=UPI0021D8386C|nr:RHS repeat-associated core domain-containing protein [Pseudomonas sp. RIT-PI-AD]